MFVRATTRSRSFALVTTSLALALAAAACSSTGATPVPATGGSGEVRAALSEWMIGLSAASAPAGRVAFAITNQGAVPHEFQVIRTDMMADSLPVKDSMIDIQAMGGPMDTGMSMPGTSPNPDMEHPAGMVGLVDNVQAGGTAQLVLDELAAGHYVIICDIAGHYQQGMRTDFTVRP